MNNFVRSGDVKEILKIGRKANSIRVSRFDVQGKIAIPIDQNRMTKELLEKHKLKPEDTAAVLSEGFSIIDDDLKQALIILSREGISKRFDDYIKDLMAKRIPEETKKWPDFPFVFDRGHKTKLRWVLIRVDTREKFLGTVQLSFKLTGKDLLYKDELYRIAPPKDGGLDEDE
jgi:hypothetical protein